METTSKRLGPPGYTQWKDYSTIPAAKIMIGVAIAGAFAYILAWFGEWVPINDGLSGKEFSAFASKAMRFIYDAFTMIHGRCRFWYLSIHPR